ncbi:MAG: hypothetical protein WCR01_02000 [Bacteroidota bacterium]
MIRIMHHPSEPGFFSFGGESFFASYQQLINKKDGMLKITIGIKAAGQDDGVDHLWPM